MKKISFLAAFLVLVLAVGGCVDNDRSLTIIKVLAPSSSDGCAYDVDSIFYTSGRLDLAFPVFDGEPFSDMAVQVRNALPPISSGQSAGNLYAHDIQMERIEISYSFEQGRELVEGLAPALLLLEDQKSQLLMSGTFFAETDDNIIFDIFVIQSQVGALLYALGEEADQVILGVSIRLIGSTLGGDRIESNEFLFPIKLCWGCLSAAICPDGSFRGCLPGQDAVDGECLVVEEE